MTVTPITHPSELPASNFRARFTTERTVQGRRTPLELTDIPVIRYTGTQHARIDPGAARFDYVVLWHPIRQWPGQTPITSGDYVHFTDLAEGAGQQLYDVHMDVGTTGVMVGYISPVAESQGGQQ